MGKRFLCILLTLLLVLGAGCQKKEQDDLPDGVDQPADKDNQADTDYYYPVTFTDDSGAEVTVEKAPAVIASGSPAATEIIYAIGKDDILAGVTDYCNYPVAVKEKEVTGGYNNPNIEKLIEKGVDLYICENLDDAVKKQLSDAGIATVISKATGYESVYDEIEMIGKALNAIDKADEVITNMKDQTQLLLTRIKGLPGKRVFYEVWHDPLMSAGSGSFIDDIITMAGGENIAKDMASEFGEFSQELVLERDPEVYLTTDDGFKTVEEIKARAGYSDMTAVKDERIYFLDSDIMSRPGPRMVQALELVARTVHPATFQEK